MAVTKAKKSEILNHLIAELKDAKSVWFAQTNGMTVSEFSELRADLRNANAEYKVIKNNIIKRALDANGESALDEALEGPVALSLLIESSVKRLLLYK